MLKIIYSSYVDTNALEQSYIKLFIAYYRQTPMGPPYSFHILAKARDHKYNAKALI